MDIEVIKACAEVAQTLAKVKHKVAIHLREKDVAAYEDIRNQINDCQEVLAILCDCAPIKLMSGRVEEIWQNLDWKNKRVEPAQQLDHF